jgi:putative DNA primase/helicase
VSVDLEREDEMILLNTAQEYHAAGLSVLPARRQEKRPAIPTWKEFQEQLPSASHIAAWFARKQDALCVICGEVSGNLEVLDFDNHGRTVSTPGVHPSRRRSATGWLSNRHRRAASHVAYRCPEGISGNLKLAVGLRDGKRMTLIETRGEGGLVLCAPTEGYQLIQGDYTHLGTAFRQ